MASEQLDFSEVLEKYNDKNRIDSVQDFRNLVSILDDKYRDVEDFLSDNPGCLEAMIEWISEYGEHSYGWKDNLRIELEAQEEDETDDE